MDKIDFDEMFDVTLDINDPDIEEKLIQALGAKDGEVLEITTPQFDREDGVTPSLPDYFGLLHRLGKDTLKEIGCRPWDEPDKDGNMLMLFPAEWYDYIPEGFKVTTISGETEYFEKGKTDDDRRMGVLAYGVVIQVFYPKSNK